MGLNAANLTPADERFAALFDKGLSRAEIRQALDMTSSQYDGRKRRLAILRERLS